MTTDSHGSFTLTLSDTTTGQQLTTIVKTLTSGKAEVGRGDRRGALVRHGGAPADQLREGQLLERQVNGASIGRASSEKITMVQSNGNPKATPSAITGGNAFSVTWNHK